jgi:hypothetical protein
VGRRWNINQKGRKGERINEINMEEKNNKKKRKRR